MERGHTHLTLLRDTHLFSSRPQDVEKLEQRSRVIRLAPDQIFRPAEPGKRPGEMPDEEPDAPPAETEFVVRRGKLRVSRFLPDGREVTLAVLQAGAAFVTATAAGTGDDSAVDQATDRAADRAADPEADRYDLDDIVLMALSEGELWAAPEGTLRLERP